VSRAEKRALNVHLHRRHNQANMNDEGRDLRRRLALHEELHNTTVCDHSHEDFSDPGSFAQTQDA
jgi:hypothetical protein